MDATRRRRMVGLVSAGLSAALVTGCTQPAITTTTDAAGNTVTLEWKGYPASAGVPASDVLTLPVAEDVEARAGQIIGEIQDALGAEYGIHDWRTPNEGGWFPQDGNGYGGESLLTTYNSATYEAAIQIPVDEWDAVIDTARGILRSHHIPGESNATYFEEHPAWMRVGTFHRGTEFFDVVVEDRSLDPDYKRDDSDANLVAGVSLFYGITTIAQGDRAEFIRRAAPFEGLKLPEATTSD